MGRSRSGVPLGAVVGLDEDATLSHSRAADRATQPVSRLLERRTGARRCMSANLRPRSSADQHRTFEWTKCRGSPGHSQIPPVRLCALLGSVVDQREEEPPVVIAGEWPAMPAPGQVDQPSVGIELAREVASFPTRPAGGAVAVEVFECLAARPALASEAIETWRSSAWPAAERMMNARKAAADRRMSRRRRVS